MRSKKNSFAIVFLLLMNVVYCQNAKQGISSRLFYGGVDAGYSAIGFSEGGGLGKGPGLSVYAGFMKNKTTGFELIINSLLRSSQENAFLPGLTSVGTSSVRGVYRASMLRIIPTVRLGFGEKKIHPYSRTGLIIGLPIDVNLEYKNAADTSDQVVSLNGRISWGFLQTIGVRYELNERLSVSAEIWGILQSWAPHKATLITYTRNGNDRLSSLSTSEKEAVYSSSYSEPLDSNGYPPAGQPAQNPKVYIPFSSMGFNLGLHYRLSN
ncbi:MAG TPA: hypothetical protein VGO45_09100 [Bacteroidia bacterium]|jgi:hypothetical protein|nr:hypothetical protein [Bacteroidia bacterium]